MFRFASRTDWPKVPNALSIAIEERHRRRLPILDLTESNPTRGNFVYDTKEILDALADPRSLTYSPDPRGLLSAREAVRDYYAARGAAVRPEQIFLTTSTSEAYSYVFRLLANPGEKILVPRPSYPLFDFLARLDSVELVEYPLTYDGRWRIDLHELTKKLDSQVRAVLVVNPNNPTGSFLHQEELESLLDCADQWHLAIICDEVFADYVFQDSSESGAAISPATARVVSLSAINDALTFTLSGLSKISALPQVKLAWIVASGPPEALREALVRLEVIADTYLSVSAPLAWALPRLLATRHAIQPQVLQRLRSNLRCLDESLTSASPVTRLHSEGGWYVVLRLPGMRSDEEWAVEILRREGVLTHPGHFYDFSSDGQLVISLLTLQEVFAEGIQKLLRYVATSI
jgi:alanine-synthesizing transaminase